MPAAKYELEQFLGKLGISSKTLQRIRFGGVVGKQALVAVAVALGLATVALRTSDTRVLLLCIVGLVLEAAIAHYAIGFHGHKHPVEATLEGAEVVAYQHVQHELAAKGQKEIVAAPPVLEGLGQKPIAAGSGEPNALNSASKGEPV